MMLAVMTPVIDNISSITETIKWVGLGVLGLVVLAFGGTTLLDARFDAYRQRMRIPAHPREKRRVGLLVRRGEIEMQLNGDTFGHVVLGTKQRGRLSAERALIDAELTHMNTGREGTEADSARVGGGMSTRGMHKERLRLQKERKKVLSQLDFAEIKPGPNVRQRLFAIGDEIVALEEALGSFTEPEEQDSGCSTMQQKFDAVAAAHDQVINRWGEWHTDLGLLTEFPAIHDVQHEDFALRIIDAQDAAVEAREKAEARKQDSGSLERFSDAVDEFTAALDDGEHKARLIARGPALDPVLNRIMTTAETLLSKIHAYQAGDIAVGWGECQVAADGLVKLLKPIIGHHADAIPELEATIARELETARR